MEALYNQSYYDTQREPRQPCRCEGWGCWQKPCDVWLPLPPSAPPPSPPGVMSSLFGNSFSMTGFASDMAAHVAHGAASQTVSNMLG